MPGLARPPVCHNHIGLPGQHGRDQSRNVFLRVLFVAYGIDDNVGPESQRVVQPGAKSGRQAPIRRVAHNVVRAGRSRHLARAVGRPIVDNEYFDSIDSVNLAGDRRYYGGQLLRLVVTGNLDDNLQARPSEGLSLPPCVGTERSGVSSAGRSTMAKEMSPSASRPKSEDAIACPFP